MSPLGRAAALLLAASTAWAASGSAIPGMQAPTRLVSAGSFAMGESALRAGRLQEAMDDFMAVLIEDPSHRTAREKLRETARLLLEKERRSLREERARLLQEAREAQEFRERYLARVAAAEAPWRELCRKALRLSLRRDLGEALRAYEKALDAMPPYVPSLRYLASVSKTFHARLAKSLPQFSGTMQRRLSVGEVAGALILRRRHQKDWARRFGGLEAAVDEARAISRKEARLESLLALVEAAQAYEGRIASEPAVEAWTQVAAFAPNLWEPKYHLQRLTREIQERRRRMRELKPAPPGAGVRAGRTPLRRLRGRKLELRPKPPVPRTAAPAPALEPAVPSPLESSRPEAPAPEAASPPPAESPPRNPVEAARLYRQGLRAYAVGDSAAAIVLWTEALKADPGHERARKALLHVKREQEAR